MSFFRLTKNLKLLQNNPAVRSSPLAHPGLSQQLEWSPLQDGLSLASERYVDLAEYNLCCPTQPDVRQRYLPHERREALMCSSTRAYFPLLY